MQRAQCPKCGALTVLPGLVSPPGEAGAHLCFTPFGVRLFRLSSGVAVSGTFSCCFSCGHTWTRLAPAKIRSYIESYGNELVRQYFSSLSAGPYHDLPDHPGARAAADGVAEVDALVLAGSPAVRRYRELTGTTWDQAIDTVRGWRGLTRTQKLALFGWSPKETSPPDGPGPQAHPMHDRLLDGPPTA